MHTYQLGHFRVSPNMARVPYGRAVAREGACSVGPPLERNLSTTNKSTVVQHIYTQHENDLSNMCA